MIFNRPIIAILEGYGKFNPFRLVGRFERGYFRRLENEIADTESRYLSYSDQGKEVPLDIKEQYRDLRQQRSPRFPDQERWLLPTAFGNTLRAFETYSRVMYGADAIPVWTRLLAVIPEHYREYLETAKMLVDFWVNTWVVSVVLLGVYCGNVLYFREFQLWWLPLVCLGVVYLSLEQARRAAVGWGNFVKAAFDLFLRDLQQQLKLKPTESASQVWQQFSQGVLYVDPDVMPEKHRGEEESEGQES